MASVTKANQVVIIKCQFRKILQVLYMMYCFSSVILAFTFTSLALVIVMLKNLFSLSFPVSAFIKLSNVTFPNCFD